MPSNQIISPARARRVWFAARRQVYARLASVFRSSAAGRELCFQAHPGRNWDEQYLRMEPTDQPPSEA